MKVYKYSIEVTRTSCCKFSKIHWYKSTVATDKSLDINFLAKFSYHFFFFNLILIKLAWIWHSLRCLLILIKQINYPYVHIRNKYCTNWELVSRQENEHVCSSSLYAEMSEIETDTGEKRQWLSSSCLSVVKIQTVWSAVTTNKFQKGIAIKALMQPKTSRNCYFQHESPEIISKRKPEP